ncbi:DUF742 domain-containing protein, partial [Streptomyces sp. NPDC000963]
MPGAGADPPCPEKGPSHDLHAAPRRPRRALIALVVPEPAAEDPGRDQTLSPEHVEIVERC